MFNSTYASPEDLMMEVAANQRADFFTKQALFDALPCLGWPVVSEAVDRSVQQGKMKMVIPPGGGARGTYCHGLRVNDPELERLGLKAIMPEL